MNELLTVIRDKSMLLVAAIVFSIYPMQGKSIETVAAIPSQIIAAESSADVIHADLSNNPTGISYGVHVHRALNLTTPSNTDSPSIYFPKGIAFKSWRLWDAYATWADLQPTKTTWEFSKLDNYVSLATKNNLEIILPLGMPPQWASARPDEASPYGLGRSSEPLDINDWRTYVYTIATRYKGKIRYYELWNEINLKSFYTGTFERMLEMQQVAYTTLKSVDENNILIAPSFTGNSLNEVNKLGRYLKLGACDYSDIVSYHFYTPKSHPEATIPLVSKLKEQINAVSGCEDKPLWNTESGYLVETTSVPTADAAVSPEWLRLSERDGAAYNIIAMILSNQMGVSGYFFYAWDNDLFGVIGKSGKNLHKMPVAISSFLLWQKDKKPTGCDLTGDVTECNYLSLTDSKHYKVIWRSYKSTSSILSYAVINAQLLSLCDDIEPSEAVTKNVAVDVCPIIIYQN